MFFDTINIHNENSLPSDEISYPIINKNLVHFSALNGYRN